MITADHICVDECDHPPHVCPNCGTWYPAVFPRCPHCSSTRHLDQDTHAERDGATGPEAD